MQSFSRNFIVENTAMPMSIRVLKKKIEQKCKISLYYNEKYIIYWGGGLMFHVD